MMDKNLQSYEQSFASWTDDVPTCRDSGVGSSCNEVHSKDGRRVALHEYEDRSFRFRRDEYNLCLYGVFDGFNGVQVSDYIMKCLPAEILLGQLMPEITDDQLKDLVKQAFVCLDKEYFDTIGEKLAARMVMRVEGEQSNSAHLKELEQLVSCGCSATIVTILDNRLWVSNIGDCQAFLCYQSKEEEEEEEMRISMLSIDHYLSNEDESLRLQHLGYDPPEDGGDTGLGEYNYTRCFGNYLVKGGFKENPVLATCRDDPVIAEPEIQGPIEITEDLELLVIATKSLCEAVESFSEGPAQSELARLLRQHLAAEPYNSLSTVAQSTVDHIVRMYTEREQSKATSVIKREDMTLLVRCFKNLRTDHQQRRTSSPQYQLDSQSLRRREEKTLTRSSARPRPTRSSTTTESSGVYVAHGRELPVDEDGRIEPYVDFGPFYKLWNSREENGDTSQTINNVPE